MEELGELLMAWGTMGHSKHIEPLLVRLYDSHRMYQLAENKNPESRAELSHIVSGLLDTELKQTEKEIVADILINLMRQAETDLRHAIAERLSTLESAPLRLILFMAQDEIGVAETILRSSPVLNDLDLLYIIQSRDAGYWRAIAGRKTLHEPVVDALADTRDIPTACTLANNADIELSEYAVKVMSEIAEGSKELARPLLTRPEIPETLARKLYEVVGRELEKTLNSALQIERNVLESVKDILVEFSEDPKDDYEPTAAMMKAAEMFAAKGQLSPDLMVKTLKRGQIASFIAQISCLSAIRAKKILQIIRNDNGQGMAAICAVLGFTREEYAAAYLLTRKIWTANERINQSEFNQAISYFDKLGFEQAQKIFAQYKI